MSLEFPELTGWETPDWIWQFVISGLRCGKYGTLPDDKLVSSHMVDHGHCLY